jgi:hypothetical protein
MLAMLVETYPVAYNGPDGELPSVNKRGALTDQQ